MYRVSLILILFIIALAMSTPSHAQDVYNFYFQKNNGTTGMALPPAGNPPIAPQAVQGPTESVMQTNMPVTEAKSPAKEFSKWEITPGFSETSLPSIIHRSPGYDFAYDHSGKGYGLLAGHRFNKYFSAEGAINYMHIEHLDKKYFDGAIGALITPIHINTFGYELIELSFGGGLMSVRKLDILPEGDSDKVSETSAFKPYLGGRLAVNINETVAVVVDVKAVNASDYTGHSQTVVGLKARF